MYGAAIVSKLGFVPVEAADGDQAIAQAGNCVPELIILDINMPGKDGLQTLKELRADPRLRETPILVLTVEAGRGTLRQALDYGANDYAIKPLRPKELRWRICQRLGIVDSDDAEESCSRGS